ncbi:MAG TPA: flagellar hook capping FlgD N-terminal domain-containing protein [Phycisphaerae bacterium]|nr:flagellar hook capping FlgD N-terminal domain-containing protein [Phycisphaerae bacterium]HRY69761.1 flagellar hook capping FlgD N-terminal domain-containing protein [Phycisphaerae bacterium]HSA29237.1 flagellar hook capping FlgD N-terminal domain-containing protein [Phycisphaerae bacterium]
MSVSSILGSNSATAGTATAAAGLSGMTGEDFMKILVAQLQYQDPMEPMTNEEMVAQMSSIRELEMNTRLSEKLSLLSDQQRFGAAASLIGKYVKGAVSDDSGTTFSMEGVVTAVRFNESGEAMLELDSGETLPLASLTEINAGTSTSTSGQQVA